MTKLPTAFEPDHPAPQPLLEVRGIGVSYPDTPSVIRGFDFTLQQGEIACLLGASGCGKTTALRAIAGFLPIFEGEIRLDGQVVSRAGLQVPPEVRRIGVVFQDYALFPHLNVGRNIAFGLRYLGRKAASERVKEMLELVGLEHLDERFPHELSGGQQQRIALARALAPAPRLLLLDEPFSNLDVDLRERLSLEVRDILKRSGTTAILVTHDQNEAFAMADRIGVMRDGCIEQIDLSYTLYHQPATRYVADFVGMGVFLKGRIHCAGQLSTELGILKLEGALANSACGRELDVLIRPDDIVHDDHSKQTATVIRRAFRGAQFLYTLRLDSGDQVMALVPSHHDHPPGSRIGIRLELDHVVAFQA